MSLTYRSLTSALTRPHRKQAGESSLHQSPPAHDLGFSGQITCSPWEGIYLDQGQSWSSENEAASSLDEELDRFLAQILPGK